MDTGGTGENAMVYVVDDDPSVRSSIENLIRSTGLKVKVFASGEAFLRSGVGALEVPACAVLDVRLRGMSGLDLQKQITEAQIQVPIIFITGHGDIRMGVYAMKAGAVEFLTKPFSDHDLIEAVRNGIERSRAAHRRSSEVTKLESPIVSAARDELDRLANEIHDGLAQHLSAIHIQLAAAKDGISSPNGSLLLNLEQAVEIAKRELMETRRCAHNLRARLVEESVLTAELEQLAQRWDVGGRWRCHFQADNLPENKLSPAAKHQLLRIAQEAINNAARHANPTVILLTLRWQSSKIVLRITDNGKGFSAGALKTSEGLGLRNMRKRAEEIGGKLEIQTSEGRGTSITVRVPVP
ncbi:MAG: response regulator [Verrucomicrobia bacterium]|nr:response regulator [Verrucomicrobiota bacterium]